MIFNTLIAILGFIAGIGATCFWLSNVLPVGFYRRQWDLLKCRLDFHGWKKVRQFSVSEREHKVVHQCQTCGLYLTKRVTIYPPTAPPEKEEK